ncbi:DUF1684 domain-containing protein [Bizionia gelidisalsuginis]|uniref:DUF1684 domain-containing protein n=1 Tax=Bizionia gelidisalsuginis TaxID=291188 RepID=A0ABY3MDW9_9FLAO|nr:DUF1684 domain-containing protein [Bizionia gelidisalsuginis]TYC17136.1 DUF1684 domain-containing protein [Bizionia gelidisalsuginis]
MKNLSALIVIVVFVLSCSQNKTPVMGDTPFQKKINSEFKDATTSPLKAKDRKTFRSLDFYTYDNDFVVSATVKRTPDSEFFNMKTTTDRLTKSRVYGVLTFKLKDSTYQLNVYQDKVLMTTEGFENYLLLPFLDETNGEATYGAGRYIDLEIPDSDTLIIDFNSAYNPYCAYNETYSCPLVPSINYLETIVEAGVKKYKKH